MVGEPGRIIKNIMKKQTKRGGLRNPPGGRPPLKVKREKHSPTLAPGTKQLAQAIAKERGYAGWGHAIDEAIKKLAKKMGLDNNERKIK